MNDDPVVDSSAVMSVIEGEPGRAVVEALLGHIVVSSVNLPEVVAKLNERGLSDAEVEGVLSRVPHETIDFTERLAFRAGMLRSATRRYGLSFGDRACLATTLELGVPVYTADRQWANLGLPVDVRLIR